MSGIVYKEKCDSFDIEIVDITNKQILMVYNGDNEDEDICIEMGTLEVPDQSCVIEINVKINNDQGGGSVNIDEISFSS
jgi:hypothetical protein